MRKRRSRDCGVKPVPMGRQLGDMCGVEMSKKINFPRKSVLRVQENIVESDSLDTAHFA